MLCDAQERYARAAARATDVHAPALDPIGGGRASSRHDKLERSAQELMEAENALRRAQAWQGVFDEVDTVLQDDQDRAVANALYDLHQTQAEVARTLYMDRQTVRNVRDKYVCNTAIAAAARGLIRYSWRNDDGQQT